MDLDDFVGAEVGVAVAATAAVLSPRVRGVLRRGAVYGIAGALIAGGAVSSGARGIGRGARQAAGSAGGAVQGAASRVGGGAQTTGSGS
jgi:hypothetical protein